MPYPFRYPEVYAELARQGKNKAELAAVLGITLAGLRYKQQLRYSGDFTVEEMKKTAAFLNGSAVTLFKLDIEEDANVVEVVC